MQTFITVRSVLVGVVDAIDLPHQRVEHVLPAAVLRVELQRVAGALARDLFRDGDRSGVGGSVCAVARPRGVVLAAAAAVVRRAGVPPAAAAVAGGFWRRGGGRARGGGGGGAGGGARGGGGAAPARDAAGPARAS